MESNYRKPTKEEEALIDFLIKKSLRNFSSNWKAKITVQPMNDGGMGSLVICTKDKKEQERRFGEQISEYCFTDQDGIDVIVSLNVDNNGNLFELDIWKTDFTPLIKFPSPPARRSVHATPS
jgi:hypothetical protein